MKPEEELIRLRAGEEKHKNYMIGLIRGGNWAELEKHLEKGKAFEKDIKDLEEQLKESS